MRFANIKPVGRQLYWVHIRTPRYQYDAVLSSKPGTRHGSRYFQGDDGRRSCRGFTRRIDYVRDLVTMRIPRRCLQEPRWIRLGPDRYSLGGPPGFRTSLLSWSPPYPHASSWGRRSLSTRHRPMHSGGVRSPRVHHREEVHRP